METFREQKHYIWLQPHITWSAETQMLMAVLNNKQLGINVNIRTLILDTPISPTLWNSSTGWGRVMSTEVCKSSQRLKPQNLSGPPDVQTPRLGSSFSPRAVWKQTKAESSDHFLALVTLQLEVNRSNGASHMSFPEWSQVMSCTQRDWAERLLGKLHLRVPQHRTQVLGNRVQTKLQTGISSTRDSGQRKA